MTKNDLSNKVCICKIGKPFGVRGGAKLITYTNDPSDLLDFSKITDEQGAEYKIEHVYKRAQNALYVGFLGVTNREQAESLVNIALFVKRDELPKLPSESFYYCDLIGFTVFNKKNEKIGIIVGINNFGASDVVEIANGDEETIFHPLISSFVIEYRFSEKELYLNVD